MIPEEFDVEKSVDDELNVPTDSDFLKRMTKYIFITGGVVSSLGKGIVTSSLASLLKLSKFNLRIRKLIHI